MMFFGPSSAKTAYTTLLLKITAATLPGLMQQSVCSLQFDVRMPSQSMSMSAFQKYALPALQIEIVDRSPSSVAYLPDGELQVFTLARSWLALGPAWMEMVASAGLTRNGSESSATVTSTNASLRRIADPPVPLADC